MMKDENYQQAKSESCRKTLGIVKYQSAYQSKQCCRGFLTLSQVCVNAHVACRPSQTLVLPVRDVFFGLRVYVLFGQTKVDDVDGVLPLASWPPNQEVFWLHISVYQTLGVDILHPCYLGAQ